MQVEEECLGRLWGESRCAGTMAVELHGQRGEQVNDGDGSDRIYEMFKISWMEGCDVVGESRIEGVQLW